MTAKANVKTSIPQYKPKIHVIDTCSDGSKDACIDNDDDRYFDRVLLAGLNSNRNFKMIHPVIGMFSLK
jgi:hypothetical protein